MTVMSVVEVVGVSPSGHTSGAPPVKRVASARDASSLWALLYDHYRRYAGIKFVGQTEKLYYLAGAPRIAHEEHHVVGLQHAEIAVLGFA